MNFKKSHSIILAIALAGLSFAACGGDDDLPAADSGTNNDAGTTYVCDPVGANADQSALFNVPVAGDVEVIVKEPQHPGFPGPTDLP